MRAAGGFVDPTLVAPQPVLAKAIRQSSGVKL